MALDLDALKAERDNIKQTLRELEAESRRLESDAKSLRQREVLAKRAIDALSSLIEIGESRAQDSQGESSAPEP